MIDYLVSYPSAYHSINQQGHVHFCTSTCVIMNTYHYKHILGMNYILGTIIYFLPKSLNKKCIVVIYDALLTSSFHSEPYTVDLGIVPAVKR